MRIEDLRYLIQVADTGSISLAADACYITQQGLSRIISNLEKELGVPLFHRSKNHIRLTDIGELVVERARELDGLYQHMLNDISRASAKEGQPPVDYHIYTSQLISSTLLSVLPSNVVMSIWKTNVACSPDVALKPLTFLSITREPYLGVCSGLSTTSDNS